VSIHLAATIVPEHSPPGDDTSGVPMLSPDTAVPLMIASPALVVPGLVGASRSPHPVVPTLARIAGIVRIGVGILNMDRLLLRGAQRSANACSGPSETRHSTIAARYLSDGATSDLLHRRSARVVV